MYVFLTKFNARKEQIQDNVYWQSTSIDNGMKQHRHHIAVHRASCTLQHNYIKDDFKLRVVCVYSETHKKHFRQFRHF